MSQLEDILELQLKALEVEYVREHKFHPTRKWRFDFAIPSRMIAIEVEGGTWVNGAHNRGGHYQSDCEKYNEATAIGWHVYRLTGDMIKRGDIIKIVEEK